MRRILSLIATLLLCAGIFCLGGIDLPHFKTERALAQVPMTGAGLGAPSSGGGIPTFTAQTSGVNVSCGFVTTCSVTGLTVTSGFNIIGALFSNQSGSNASVSGITLCGTALSLVSGSAAIAASGDYGGAALFQGTVTGGTCTAAVTVSAASAIQNVGVALGLLSNLSSQIAGTACTVEFAGSAQGPYICGSSITIPTNGYGVCVFGFNAATTLTSTNLTISSQASGGSGVTLTAAGIGYTQTTETPQFGSSATFQNGSMSCAPWH